MYYIKRLPFILALFITIIVGLVSYSKQIDIQQIYLRMAVCLGSFLLVGVFYKKVVNQLEFEIEYNKAHIKEESDEREKEPVNSQIEESKLSNTQEDEKIIKETELDAQDSDEFSPWDLNDIIVKSEQKKK